MRDKRLPAAHRRSPSGPAPHSLHVALAPYITAPGHRVYRSYLGSILAAASLRARPVRALRRLPINHTGTDYFVGDVHGAFPDLERALARIQFDRQRDRLITTGDLIDRGPASAAALYYLHQPWFFSVCGNHEHLLSIWLQLLATSGTTPTARLRLCAASLARRAAGGTWSLRALRHTPAARADWLATLAALPIVLEVPQRDGRIVRVVHAAMPDRQHQYPNWWRYARAMWSRTAIARVRAGEGAATPTDDTARPRALVIVGHTPVARPFRAGTTVFLDTGSGSRGGYLSIVSAAAAFQYTSCRLPAAARTHQWQHHAALVSG